MLPLSLPFPPLGLCCPCDCSCCAGRAGGLVRPEPQGEDPKVVQIHQKLEIVIVHPRQSGGTIKRSPSRMPKGAGGSAPGMHRTAPAPMESTSSPAAAVGPPEAMPNHSCRSNRGGWYGPQRTWCWRGRSPAGSSGRFLYLAAGDLRRCEEEGGVASGVGFGGAVWLIEELRGVPPLLVSAPAVAAPAATVAPRSQPVAAPAIASTVDRVKQEKTPPPAVASVPDATVPNPRRL